jgi:hypothetical protein
MGLVAASCNLSKHDLHSLDLCKSTPLLNGEVYLAHNTQSCCDDRRHMGVPKPLANFIGTLIALKQPRQQTNISSQQTPGSQRVGSQTTIQNSGGAPRYQNQQRSASQSISPSTSHPGRFQAATGTATTSVVATFPRVMKLMFVVQSQYDYYLAQLDVRSGTSTVQFFALLRAEYFKIRGFFTRYFSVVMVLFTM